MSDIPVLTIDGEVIGCGRVEVKGSCGDAYSKMQIEISVFLTSEKKMHSTIKFNQIYSQFLIMK
jgi:hypothetical protein